MLLSLLRENFWLASAFTFQLSNLLTGVTIIPPDIARPATFVEADFRLYFTRIPKYRLLPGCYQFSQLYHLSMF
jgi:hypothetical protein